MTNDTINNDYIRNRSLLEAITKCACTLSANTSGRMVDSRREQIASVIFGKVALHAYTMLQVAPSRCNNAPDYASVFVLTRSVMDGYCTMYYISIDDIGDDERNFRILLADYHAKKQRVDMLHALKLTPRELPTEEDDVNKLRTILENHKYLPQTDKNKIINGKKPLVLSNTEICAKAGITERYYKPIYNFLSSYTHGYPISLDQIEATSKNEDVLGLMIPFLHVCSGYLCFAIRDFIKLFPDQNVFVDSFIRQNIALYEEYFGRKS